MDKVDTLLVMISSILIMLMSPGVGFFYSGMLKGEQSKLIVFYSLTIYCTVSVVWYLIGFSLVYGESQSGFVGNLEFVCNFNVNISPHFYYAKTIPFSLFFFNQLMFACLPPIIIIGTVIGRMKWISMLLFVILWTLTVYCPIAHRTWNQYGWANTYGVLDFAGGNVVHISSGFSSLALAIILGRNQDDKPTSQIILSNLLGTTLIWFGFFGFNGGSAFSLSDSSVLSLINTNISGVVAGLGWLYMEYLDGASPSILGLTNGCVCGLVAITPASGYVAPWASFLVGIGAAFLSFIFIKKIKFLIFAGNYDDTLDVFGCHGVAGFWGGIATGLFAQNLNPDYSTFNTGAFFGNQIQIIDQVIGVFTTAGWSFLVTLIISFFLKITVGLSIVKKNQIADILETEVDGAQVQDDFEQKVILAYKKFITSTQITQNE